MYVAPSYVTYFSTKKKILLLFQIRIVYFNNRNLKNMNTMSLNGEKGELVIVKRKKNNTALL